MQASPAVRRGLFSFAAAPGGGRDAPGGFQQQERLKDVAEAAPEGGGGGGGVASVEAREEVGARPGFSRGPFVGQRPRLPTLAFALALWSVFPCGAR